MPGRNSTARRHSIQTRKSVRLIGKKIVPQPKGLRLDRGERELNAYIRNGLRLHNELLVHHEAMSAAKQEYLDEYVRKRQ